MTEHAHRVSERIGPGSVSVTRTGTRTFEGMNERGSTVRIGRPPSRRRTSRRASCSSSHSSGAPA